jgi:NAD(P)-dependent dehydrogenase (short-subunit alcohol dehydrogenase family)
MNSPSQGPIHILVNNAGVSHIGSLENTTEADFERIFRVNVKGFYNCMFASIGHMTDQSNPKVQEWENLMWRFQQSLPQAKPGEKWLLMEKIFDLES